MDTLVQKTVISVLSAIIFLVIFYNKSLLLKATSKHENTFFILSALIFRIIPVFIVYLFLDFDAKSDVVMFYNWAQSAKKLEFVYRDFDSPYAPLFSYITAVPLYIYNNANMIVLLMVAIEVVILGFSYHYFSKIYSKGIALYQSLLYLTLPASLILSVFSGQEDIWMWGIIIVAMIVYKKTNNSFWVGFIFGIGMITTKVLFVFSLPIAFILLPNKLKYIAGLLLIGAPTLIILIYFGGDSFLLPIQQANDPRNPNIWSILNPIFQVYDNIGIKTLNLFGLVSNILLVVFVTWKAQMEKKSFLEAFPLIWILSNCWIMIIQQSSLSNYCYVYLMPMVFIFIREKSITFTLILLLFCIACAIQPPIWWGLKMPIYNDLNAFNKSINLVEYLLEIFIIGCIIYFCKIIINQLFIKKTF